MQKYCSLSDFVEKFASIEHELPSFKKFLKTVRIYRVSKQERHHVPPQLRHKRHYKRYLRLITITLLRQKSKNVLLSGMPEVVKQAYTKKITSALNHKSSFFNMGELHSYNWQRVFQLLGSLRLSELIINWKGFVVKQNVNGGKGNEEGFVQIFGNGLQYTQRVVSRETKCIEKHDVLSKGHRNPRFWHYTLVKSTGDELVKEIFGQEAKARRFRQVKKVLETILENDKKCRYDILYQRMLLASKTVDVDNITSNASSQEEVIRFIFVILGKLLSLEAWGGPANKKVFRDKTIQYLKLESQSRVHIHDICQGLKLSGFEWFGKASISSKQDFEVRTTMMQQYTQWIFESLVKKIIKEFWHVSVSTDGKMLYFPKYVWHKISYLWLERYAQENFIQTGLTGREKYNYGKIKLIPKRATFRVVCVPAKREIAHVARKLDPQTMTKQEIAFNIFRANELRPVRLTLLKKLNERKRENVCYQTTATSNQQVAERIMDFRAELLTKFGGTSIPKLYMVKWDMRECYDQINQKQLMSKVVDLFKSDPLGTKYYCRTYSKVDQFLRIKQVKHKVESNFAEFDLMTSDADDRGNNGKSTRPTMTKMTKMTIDKGKTVTLTRKDILDMCIQQIFGAKAIFRNPITQELSYYRRKKGVFQGFSLSSIFCDIIYSALVADKFKFLWDSGSPFSLTRMVDDFIFISPDRDLYDKVYAIVQDSNNALAKYGAFVNSAKTIVVNDDTTDERINFVGLDIEVATLKFKKDYYQSDMSDAGGIITSQYRTFQSVLAYLKKSYSLRLHHYLLVCENDQLGSVKENVTNLMEFIVGIFKRAYRRIASLDTFKPARFIHFLSYLIADTLTKFVKYNSSFESVDDLFESIQHCLIYVLKNEKQYQPVVNWIYDLKIEWFLGAD
ncbi:uncharacterized protein LODBEIA_P04130 [Lodderomyces beijingensis]|uniref:Telomerase reverse transcriptase n=1 Tax=Lodderomyces beijingensis TaxID=1775926 RepID=A0ABP0ZDC9_9ASCO